jgi:hypothetical protein
VNDLFDTVDSSPKEETFEASQPETEAKEDGDESQVLAEIPAEQDSEEVIEDSDEAAESEETPDADQTVEKKQEAQKQVNVVEEDPYEFDKCLITIAMALIPDDGSPDGRKVMLGVRNHQDEPLLTTCRLSDLMPLPDPVQLLIEQLKEQLPARSEKAVERKKAAEEKKKTASAPRTKAAPAAKSKKAEGSKAAAMNLFDMFDK